MKGKFVTFEGCEGVGKSKQIQLLQDYLKSIGKDFYLTREPGGSKISEQIRSVILDGKNVNMSGACEALLYAAARVQLLDEIIKDKLDGGELVINTVAKSKDINDNEILGCLIIGTHCSIPSIRKAIANNASEIKFVMFYSLKDEAITTIPMIDQQLAMDEKYYSEEKLENLKIWTRRKR